MPSFEDFRNILRTKVGEHYWSSVSPFVSALEEKAKTPKSILPDVERVYQYIMQNWYVDDSDEVLKTLPEQPILLKCITEVLISLQLRKLKTLISFQSSHSN